MTHMTSKEIGALSKEEFERLLKEQEEHLRKITHPAVWPVMMFIGHLVDIAAWVCGCVVKGFKATKKLVS